MLLIPRLQASTGTCFLVARLQKCRRGSKRLRMMPERIIGIPSPVERMISYRRRRAGKGRDLVGTNGDRRDLSVGISKNLFLHLLW